MLNNTITLVTVTKNRPQCFRRLQHWIAAQDYTGSFRWLVVNDSEQDTYSYQMGQTVFKRQDCGSLPSICGNWLAACDLIETEWVVVVEDDDYYSSAYLSATVRQLEDCDLFGWSHSVYYNVRFQTYRRLMNVSHAALACTAFRRSVLPCLADCASVGDVFIDGLLWDRFDGRTKLVALDRDKPLTVGIKGHGEGGVLSPSHTDPAYGTYDNGSRVLRQWLGADSLIYKNLVDNLS